MRRKFLITILVMMVLLVSSFGVGLALSSTSYDMPKYSMQGGGAGGGSVSSTNYQMVGSFSGSMQFTASTTSQTLCSGFLCGASSLLDLSRLIYRF